MVLYLPRTLVATFLLQLRAHAAIVGKDSKSLHNLCDWFDDWNATVGWFFASRHDSVPTADSNFWPHCTLILLRIAIEPLTGALATPLPPAESRQGMESSVHDARS